MNLLFALLLTESSARDLDMLACFGSGERDEDDWSKILQEADPRFRIVNVTTIGPLGVIEVVWED